MKKDVIVGMGEALWDVLPEGRKIGGAPANFAYHAKQFGYDSHVVSAVGADELGREILDNLGEKEMNLEIATVEFPTGTVDVKFTRPGMPEYSINEGAAWDNIPWSDSLGELASRTKAVCFGSLAQRSAISRNTIRRFIDAMPQGEDVLKVYDINLRQHYYSREVIEDSLLAANILKINDDEIKIVSRLFEFGDVSMENACWILLAKYGLKMVILTCGDKGSYVFAPGEKSYMDTPKVEVADTVGAGDSFTAAFISSILRGKPLREAHRAAVETSAFVCTQAGAMPLLPPEITA